MRKILIILSFFFAFGAKAQTFYDIKTLKKENGRISAYNSTNVQIFQVECDDATWLQFQDGSIKVWDDKKEYTIFSTKLTSPAWGAVRDSLNKWMDECSSTASPFPTNLDTMQTDTSLIAAEQLNVVNQQLSEIKAKLYSISFDTSTIDTSLVLPQINANILEQLYILNSKGLDSSQIDTSLIMPTLTQNIIDSLGKLLSYYPISSGGDTSNYWILDSIFNELKTVDTFCLTGALMVKDSLLNTTVVDCNGENALNVKVCNSVADTSNQSVLYEIRDSIGITNSYLSQFEFTTCGSVAIPTSFVGFKFDNINDLGCAGGLPSGIEICDFQHCTSSTPATCIPMSDQIAMQSFINSTLIPDLNVCFGSSFVANDIIYVYNAALDEVEVWYNPALIAINATPHNFVIVQLGTGIDCDKPFPSISISTSSSGGGSALLTSICGEVNVSIDSNQTRKVVSIDNFPTYNINETFDVNNTTLTLTANTYHSYTIIGLTGTFTLTEQGAVSNIPAGVTISKTAGTTFDNIVSITTTDRVLVTTIR